MRLMRFSILNAVSIILLLTAVAIFLFNPFGEEEFGILILPSLLLIASAVIFVFDLIVKMLVKKRRSVYLFTQIVILEIVLGVLVFLIKN
jgi:hypothetical protein